MINAAEQLFEQNGEYSSLLWIDYPVRPLIFLIHDHGWWKGFPDKCEGQVVQEPHPGTVGGFAFLIEKAGLDSLLGDPPEPERSYRAEVVEFIGTEAEQPYWEITHPDGRLLRLELPGMNVHVTYP